MPLVRISFIKGNSPDSGKQVGATVYQAVRDTINVPEHDHFQVISEHEPHELTYRTHLVIWRTEGIVVIQITFNEGRPPELKKTLYKPIADKLHTILDILREDVSINLVEVKKENWSFGNGIGMYAS